jgi:hypothetical protein
MRDGHSCCGLESVPVQVRQPPNRLDGSTAVGKALFGPLDADDFKLPNLYSSGRGCPVEPNDDDASPSQENAIRALEDG